jgi:hypothetical protein
VDPTEEGVEVATVAQSDLISVGGGVTGSRSTGPGSSRSPRAARALRAPRCGVSGAWIRPGGWRPDSHDWEGDGGGATVQCVGKKERERREGSKPRLIPC